MSLHVPRGGDATGRQRGRLCVYDKHLRIRTGDEA